MESCLESTETNLCISSLRRKYRLDTTKCYYYWICIRSIFFNLGFMGYMRHNLDVCSFPPHFTHILQLLDEHLPCSRLNTNNNYFVSTDSCIGTECLQCIQMLMMCMTSVSPHRTKYRVLFHVFVSVLLAGVGDFVRGSRASKYNNANDVVESP